MSNAYHIELNGLKLEEPIYYLAYIIDYKKTSGDVSSVTRTSANGQFNQDITFYMDEFLKDPYRFPQKGRQYLAFLKFQGREYRYNGGFVMTDEVLNKHESYGAYYQKPRTPFWDFKLYVYVPISELKAPIEGYGIAIYNEYRNLTYLKGDVDLVYAEDLRFGDLGKGRLYHSHPYELAGSIKKFYATSSDGDLVRAEVDNFNVQPTYYTLNTPILSIKAPTEADENLIKSQGRYIIYR